MKLLNKLTLKNLYDDLQKGGQLMGDGALVAQAAEGGGNVEGQNGDDDLAHNVQHLSLIHI